LQSLRQFSKAWHCFVVTDKRHQNRKPHEQAHAVFKKILLSLCSNGICYPTQKFKAKDEVQEATGKKLDGSCIKYSESDLFYFSIPQTMNSNETNHTRNNV
jgi:hypothetical protein